ncbi:glycosyltransferase family 4 protein [Paenibacillus methanolicus]|uniref:Glycosyltransferase involved in cell wall biosynthesis n=1 Tax=Paenibacillus methanolicus TaxID=582686 RepID=A0A5S5C8J5_9BACL|nr:glycosyltransferase family 4 protein [Paenibacillus methanolicus]TYP75731.1 glycosyltransferase involved in cell wall biosynthesis [Paenibacillus methanolicus]
MKAKKTFCILWPGLENSHLTKDVGIIPYIMQKHHDYTARYVSLKPSVGELSWPALGQFSEPVEVDLIEPSFEFRSETILQTVFGANQEDCIRDMVGYIVKHAKDIDVLYFFGFYAFFFKVAAAYKEQNPKGKIYLKLDANLAWINNTALDEAFVAFLQRCDVVTSETMIEYLNQKWPVPVHYIPNGYYSLGSEENRLLRMFSFEEKEDVILTVGRLGTQQKATDVLLEGFKLAAPQLPPSWKLVLAGSIEPSFEPEVERFLNENPKLAERIVFLGYIQDKPLLNEWFAKAKIFALPSLYEGFANVMAEAKAHGCYFIASDIESSRDAASEHGRRGKLFDEAYRRNNRQVEYGSLHEVGDAADLARRLIEACNDPERLRVVCTRTQQDAIDHFDWVTLCKKIDHMLQTASS